nr:MULTISPECIES: nitroreductase [unclassified Hyphomonas]
MTKRFPPAPPLGEPMLSVRPSAEARAMLALRRSANKQFMGAPGPSPADLDELLQIAARVPDHRKLAPWRFVVFEGEARARFGAGLADIRAGRGDPEPEVENSRKLLLRAPVVVCVISSPVNDGRTPVWEQELSAGAVCYNLLLAANASGWAGNWLSEWPAFDADAGKLLGLEDGERVAGFIYLGTATMAPPERPRADMAEKITRWEG